MLSELLDEIEERLRLIVREEIRDALSDSKKPTNFEALATPEKERKTLKTELPILLTAEEVAEILLIDRQRVYELTRQRKTNGLPVIVLGERQYRYSKEALLKWMNREQ